MVCPNCHSDQVIAVQDQHFCINCGQAVPETAVAAAKKVSDKAPAKAPEKVAAIAVQDNGLPEGVKILPVATEPSAPDLIKSRSRLPDSTDAKDEKPAKPKRGRPKAGRLDAPKHSGPTISQSDPESNESIAAPPESDVASGVSGNTPTVDAAPLRVMSDISLRRHAKPDETLSVAKDGKNAPVDEHHKKTEHHKKAPAHKHKVHKLGLPPLHYGSVLAYSLQSRVRPRHLGIAAGAALTFAAVMAYAVWELLTVGLTHLAGGLTHLTRQNLVEILLLGALYYVGRSIGQAAITYGVMREADNRPVTLSRQIAVAVNTFGRRLILDTGFGLISLCLIYLIVVLVNVGGSVWPVNVELQVVGLFCAFLLILYLMTSFALSRGLASVALTVTNLTPRQAAKLGWKLFSHRFELLGLRFIALAMEMVLAIPLAALAIALAIATPAVYHLPVALAIGVLAWISGALLGAGTAAWWAKLYRNIVLADHGDTAVSMLSGRQVLEPRPLPLAFVVSVSTLLVAAVLALPWISFA